MTEVIAANFVPDLPKKHTIDGQPFAARRYEVSGDNHPQWSVFGRSAMRRCIEACLDHPTSTGTTAAVASYSPRLARRLLASIGTDSGWRPSAGRREPSCRIHGEFACRAALGELAIVGSSQQAAVVRSADNQEARRTPCRPSQNFLAWRPAWRFPWASPFGLYGSADGPAGRVRNVPRRYTSKRSVVQPAALPSGTPLCPSTGTKAADRTSGRQPPVHEVTPTDGNSRVFSPGATTMKCDWDDRTARQRSRS